MRRIGLYRPANYFIRIVLTIAMTVVGFLTVFFGITYTKSKNTVTELQQQSVRKVLQQVDYNINYLNQMVVNLAVSAFADRNITALLNTRELDTFELTGKLATMEKIVVTNPYVHSIVLYNSLNGCYYSTSDSSMAMCGSPDADNSLSRYLRKGEPIVKLKLIPTDYDEATGAVRMFSVFMYKSLDSFHSNESVFMLNVKPEWLFDNVRTINQLGGSRNTRFYIMNAEGRFFTSDDRGLPGETFRNALYERIRGSASGNDSFIERLVGKKQIVTFSQSQTNGLSVINVEPYETVFGSIDRIKRFFVLMLGLFVACSIGVSLWFAANLYKPVRSLLDAFRPDARELPAPVRDEFVFMSTVYRQTMHKLSEYKEKQLQSHNIVWTYKLRQFFADSESFDSAAGEWLFGQPFAEDEEMCVVVLKIDDYKAFREKRRQAEQQLIRFAITNVCGEIVNRTFAGQVVDMRGDHCAALLRIGQHRDWMREVAGMMREVQTVIADYYQVSLTASVSDAFGDCRRTSAVYAATEESAVYRFFSGKRSIITPEDASRLRTLPEERRTFPSELERKLAEAIRSGDVQEVESRLTAVFAHLSRQDYDYAVNAILHLIVVVNQTVRDIDARSPHAQPATIDMKAYQRVFEQDTLDDVYRQFMAMLRGMLEQRTTGRAVKPDILVDTIKEIVGAHYNEPALGLPFIAEMMRMTPAYVGRLFKKSGNVSLIDYIHEVRLMHAVALLQDEDYSVAEIMRKVGYANESHFFKMFKRKTGVTPSEYRKSALSLP